MEQTITAVTENHCFGKISSEIVTNKYTQETNFIYMLLYLHSFEHNLISNHIIFVIVQNTCTSTF